MYPPAESHPLLRRPVVVGLLIAGWLLGLWCYGYQMTPFKAGDLFIYRGGGLAALARNGSLYTTEPLPGWSFTYTPFAAVLFSIWGLIPERLFRLCVMAMFTLSYAAALRSGVLVARELRRRLSWTGWTSTLATAGIVLATVLSFASHVTFAQGQINLILTWLVLEDLIGAWPRRWRGALVGVATGIKLTPGLFGLAFLVRRRWRSVAGIVAGFLTTVGVAAVVLPRESAQFWLHLILDTTRPGDTSMARNQSLKGMVWRAVGAQDWLWLLLAGLTLAAVVFVWLRLPRERELEAISVTALGTLLLSPVSWDHHWVWTVTIACGMIAAVAGHDDRRTVVRAGALGLMLWIVQHTQIIVWEPPLGLRESRLLVWGYMTVTSNLVGLVGVAILAWWVLQAYRGRLTA